MKVKGLCHFFYETGTEGGYWAVMDEQYMKEDGWDIEGLRILQTGDTLVVYDKDVPTQVAWQGDVVLKKLGPMGEGGAWGMSVWSEQEGVDPETWALYFLEQWPAELTTEEE